jgi:hypothetical protein
MADVKIKVVVDESAVKGEDAKKVATAVEMAEAKIKVAGTVAVDESAVATLV